MKFELTTAYKLAGGNPQIPDIEVFTVTTETRIGKRGQLETYHVIEIASIEDLLMFCREVKGEVIGYGDVIVTANGRGDGQLPLLVIYDYFRG